jgi:voltage-gated potassium channel
VIATLRELYDEDTERAQVFRYTVLAFDILTVVFVVITSFMRPHALIEAIDLVFGTLILTDLVARMLASGRKWRFFLDPATAADLVSLVSFLAPVAGEGFGFLRILRTLRLLHTYQLLARLRQDFPVFRRGEAVILASLNLCVFLFIMTGLIYATQHGKNEQIGNYADALYFTVTTLTTTGFGDITLEGTSGRLLAVGVMIVGVTLFLRLAQVLFRPLKVRHTCPVCGLTLHDADAVHCKHCGTTLAIETEGLV